MGDPERIRRELAGGELERLLAAPGRGESFPYLDGLALEVWGGRGHDPVVLIRGPRGGVRVAFELPPEVLDYLTSVLADPPPVLGEGVLCETTVSFFDHGLITVKYDNDARQDCETFVLRLSRKGQWMESIEVVGLRPSTLREALERARDLAAGKAPEGTSPAEIADLFGCS